MEKSISFDGDYLKILLGNQSNNHNGKRFDTVVKS